MTKVYPFLIASIPTLNYAANNPDQYGMGDLAFLLALTVVACGLVCALAALAVRGRAAPGVAAFITLVFVGWVFGYRRAAGVLTGDPAHPPHLLLIPVGLLLSALLVWLVRRQEAPLNLLGRFLGLMAALLVGWSAVQVVRGSIRGERMVSRSSLVRDLAQPIQGPATPRSPARDIYLIVLDEYANSGVLRERFGFDNRPFEDSLRALGFHVPRLVRSNYLHTLLSLPSLLNSAHLVALSQDLGTGTRHPRVPNHLLQQSRVAGYLQERGYEFVFFPSDWWYSTSRSDRADSTFRAFTGFDFTRALTSGELQRTVRGATILSYFGRNHHWEAEHVIHTLDGIAGLAGGGGRPQFVFAHILKPHEPYVFDARCGVMPRQREDDYAGLYLGQLQCVNRLLLATVRRILAESPVPPVILLQGDHGTKDLHAIAAPTPEEVTPAAARERFGAFGAYYLPDGGAEAFGDTVTVVNVLGNVLRRYFAADLPRQGDEQYISPAMRPYDFRKVDARWLAGDGPAGPKGRAGR